MSTRPLLALAPLAGILLAGALSACATAPATFPSGPMSSAFSTEAFGWSARSGGGGIDGRVAFSREGVAYGCTGSVALTPDTPYTRARFQTLYGSTERAAIPEAIVRARTVADPNADYRSFVRSSTCADGRFAFSGLPDGGWFLIAPVSAGGDRIVLMRRIETRGGRVITVNM